MTQCAATDTLARQLICECRIAGYPEAKIHHGAGETVRLIRIPGVSAGHAKRLDDLVKGPLVAIGFAVDYYGYDVRYGGDDFKGAMIYGSFSERRRLPR